MPDARQAVDSILVFQLWPSIQPIHRPPDLQIKPAADQRASRTSGISLKVFVGWRD